MNYIIDDLIIFMCILQCYEGVFNALKTTYYNTQQPLHYYMQVFLP